MNAGIVGTETRQSRSIADWNRVLASTSSIRAKDSGRLEGSSSQEFLFSGAEAAELTALLAVSSITHHYCMCSGEVRFVLADPKGTTLAEVTLHHGQTLRWENWYGDAMLFDGNGLVGWLADHGMPAPQRAKDYSEAQAKIHEQYDTDWLAAAPDVIRSLVRRSMTEFASIPNSPAILEPMAATLEACYVDPVERCAALAAWNAHGSCLISGFPTHESVPDALLRRFPMPVILHTLRQHRDTDTQVGMARHLLAWKARTKKELSLLTAEDGEALAAAATQAQVPWLDSLTRMVRDNAKN